MRKRWGQQFKELVQPEAVTGFPQVEQRLLPRIQICSDGIGGSVNARVMWMTSGTSRLQNPIGPSNPVVEIILPPADFDA